MLKNAHCVRTPCRCPTHLEQALLSVKCNGVSSDNGSVAIAVVAGVGGARLGCVNFHAQAGLRRKARTSGVCVCVYMRGSYHTCVQRA